MVGKGENGGNKAKQAFPPYPLLFSTLLKTNLIFWITLNLLSANAFNLDKSVILLFGNGLSLSKTLWKKAFQIRSQVLGLQRISFNPFPNKPWFLRVCSTGLLKTLWEKEKLLVTSNFSFSHSVFYPYENFFAILIKF